MTPAKATRARKLSERIINSWRKYFTKLIPKDDRRARHQEPENARLMSRLAERDPDVSVLNVSKPGFAPMLIHHQRGQIQSDSRIHD